MVVLWDVLRLPVGLKVKELFWLQPELNQAEACDLEAERSGCWRQLLRPQVQVLNSCGIMVQLACPSSCGTDEVLLCSDPR